ncbi:unnamed protein product [Mytilus edulis]|uniref:EGF-like domain-containing protein n=1 Tax=Mytilus edulis TaxID=6550 RepID=A0A8S3R176_MYTED|nr:unnamed protein product [Mytilus edulis]
MIRGKTISYASYIKKKNTKTENDLELKLAKLLENYEIDPSELLNSEIKILENELVQHREKIVTGVCQSGKQCYNDGICQSSTCKCPDGVFGDQCEYKDIRGTSFILVFPQTTYPDCQLRALIATRQNGVFHKFSFSSHFNTSTQFSPKLFTANFNYSVGIEKDGKFLRGVELTFSSKVSLYAMTSCIKPTDRYSEGYMAIPTNFLSSKCIIPQYKLNYGTAAYSSLILIAALKPNTMINIYKTENGVKSTYINFILHPYETYQLSRGADLTGTLITSTEPIAVLEGGFISTILFINKSLLHKW